jgi:hypothetical protein
MPRSAGIALGSCAGTQAHPLNPTSLPNSVRLTGPPLSRRVPGRSLAGRRPMLAGSATWSKPADARAVQRRLMTLTYDVGNFAQRSDPSSSSVSYVDCRTNAPADGGAHRSELAGAHPPRPSVLSSHNVYYVNKHISRLP